MTATNYPDLVERLLNQDLQVPFREITTGMTSSIYVVELDEPVVVKVSSLTSMGHAHDTARLHNAVAVSENLDSKNITPRVLYVEERLLDGALTSILVQTFIPGEPAGFSIHEKINAQKIVDTVYGHHLRLVKASPEFVDSSFKSLREVMYMMTEIEDAPRIVKEAEKLLNNHRFNYLTLDAPQIMIDQDSNVGNMLLDKSDGIVRKVDISPIRGPVQYQAGSFFFTYFMLNQPDDFCVDTALDYWPDKTLTKADLLLMMQPFTLILAMFWTGVLRNRVDMDPITKSGIIAHRDNVTLRCLEILARQYEEHTNQK